MENSINYVQQSATDLKLNLIVSSFDPRELTILDKASIQQENIHFEAYIIGASHALCLQVNDTQVWEIFACYDARAENKNIIYSGPAKALDSMNIKLKCGINHKFRLQFCGLDYSNAFPEFDSQNADIQLVHEFPSGINDFEIPITEISARYLPEKQTIQVKTRHAYPHEKTNVITYTEFIINGGK